MSVKSPWGHCVLNAVNRAVTFIPQRCIVYLDGDVRWFNDSNMNGGPGAYSDGVIVARNGITFITQGLSSPSAIAFGSGYYLSKTEFQQEWTDQGVTIIDGFNTTWDSSKLRDYDYTLSFLTPHDIVLASGLPGQGYWTYDAGTYYASELLYRYVNQGGRLWLNYGYFGNDVRDSNFRTKIFGDLMGMTLTSYYSADVQFGNLTLASSGDEGIISGNDGRLGQRISSQWIETWNNSLSSVYHADWTGGSNPDYSGNVIATWNPNGVGVNS